MSVEVRLTLGPERGVTLVREQAVRSDSSGSYVLIVDNQHVVRRRSVELGPLWGEMRVVRAKRGDEPSKRLAPDANYIIAGLNRVRVGQIARAVSAGKSPESDAE
jgi:multidrug efflux pump subunit AcrA (membrane-fusion protein)